MAFVINTASPDIVRSRKVLSLIREKYTHRHQPGKILCFQSFPDESQLPIQVHLRKNGNDIRAIIWSKNITSPIFNVDDNDTATQIFTAATTD